ncbi:hypothetical protein J2N86_00800 [Legionella lytica]|uniref:Uncharacterized protein n=1 Tax=Legionella lytica TaxID=96232 RepID=A0ABY4Y8T5_9GAMM|nr:hypothetical protein [Legionella lytica]USQ13921.1 hypothetical protein J2N86_00800 [Legionella lytica]
MGWWNTIVNGAQIAKDTVTDSVKWIWDWTYTPAVKVSTFAFNMMFSTLEQVQALKTSLPALGSEQSYKIVKAATKIAVYQIAPLILINMANASLQTTVRNGRDNEEDASLLYNAMVIPAATAIDWAVWGWTTQRSSHMLAQTMAIDTMGAAAFNTTKPKPKTKELTPCEREHCNFKRKVKGSLREFFVLFLNDLLTGGVSYLPYAGEIVALILKTGFAGDLITRGANLDRCERHRASAERSKIWSLGLAYVVTEMLLDKALQSTVGIPTYAVHRTMRHMLMLLFINNATQMKIDYVEPGKYDLLDPVVAYGKASGFLADVIISGSKAEIARLFQPQPNKQPFISVPDILRRLTEILNSDLERLNRPKPGPVKIVAKKIAPSIYYDSKAAVNDPVFRIFWPDMHELGLDIIDIVKMAGIPVANLTRSHIPLVATAIRNAVPELLYQRYGLSPKVTTFLINLCSDEDFWKFVQALQQWLQRHELREAPPLATASDSQLSSLHESRDHTPIQEENQELRVLNTETPPLVDLKIDTAQNHRELNIHSFHRRPNTRREKAQESTSLSLSNAIQSNYF